MSRTEEILDQELPRLAPAAAGDAFNFITNVMEFLTRWCSTFPAPKDLTAHAYCCFVGFERVSAVVSGRSDFEHRQFFKDDTPQDLLGHIYFSSFTCSSVYSRKCGLKNFNDCEALLRELGVKDQPFLLFNAADQRVVWRTEYTGDACQAALRQEPTPKFTTSDFDTALRQFYYEYTATPQGYAKPWENAAKLITKRALEAEIRDHLFLYLRFLIQEQVAVIREFLNCAGRTDLLVVFRAEKVVFYVELKVLRAFVKAGKSRTKVREEDIIAWGKKGIAQAFNYKRANADVGAAYACCFDARAKDCEIDELVAFAKIKNVEYRRYFMYSSADLFHASVLD